MICCLDSAWLLTRRGEGTSSFFARSRGRFHVSPLRFEASALLSMLVTLLRLAAISFGEVAWELVAGKGSSLVVGSAIARQSACRLILG